MDGRIAMRLSKREIKEFEIAKRAAEKQCRGKRDGTKM